MTTTPKQHTLELLRAMLNAQADFRPGQLEAIESVAIHRKRALVVQRTGWEKVSSISCHKVIT
jgi:ATP-dependent DNA helicase RecQ